MIELPELHFTDLKPIQECCDIPSNIAGIYLIFDNSKILVYVGQAKSIRNRILQHYKANNAAESLIAQYYNYYAYADVSDPVDREIYETWYINKLKPRLNRSKTFTYTSSFNEMILPQYKAEQRTNQILLRQKLSDIIEQAAKIIY